MGNTLYSCSKKNGIPLIDTSSEVNSILSESTSLSANSNENTNSISSNINSNSQEINSPPQPICKFNQDIYSLQSKQDLIDNNKQISNVNSDDEFVINYNKSSEESSINISKSCSDSNNTIFDDSNQMKLILPILKPSLVSLSSIENQNDIIDSFEIINEKYSLEVDWLDKEDIGLNCLNKEIKLVENSSKSNQTKALDIPTKAIDSTPIKNQNNTKPEKKNILNEDEITKTILNYIEDIDKYLSKRHMNLASKSPTNQLDFTKINKLLSKLDPKETNIKVNKRSYNNAINKIWKKNNGYFPYIMFYNKFFVCFLCKIENSSDKCALDHVSGKKHFRALETTYENIENEIKKGVKGKFPFLEVKEKYFCIPCKKNIVSWHELLIHLIFKNHRLNLINYTIQFLRKTLHQSITENKTFIGIENLKSHNEYFCNVCKVVLNNHYSLNNHILDRTHQKIIWEKYSSIYLCVINEFNAYRCIPCDITLYYVEQIIEHFEMDHSYDILFLKKYYIPLTSNNTNLQTETTINKSTLQNNEDKHSDCSKELGFLQNLIEWNKMQFSINNKNSKALSKFYCLPCDLGPFEPSSWSKHFKGTMHQQKVKALNLDVEEYYCQFCNNIIFTNDYGISFHYKEFHKTKMFYENRNIIACYSP